MDNTERFKEELQWWEKQRTIAAKENDLKYVYECNESIKSLKKYIDKINSK